MFPVQVEDGSAVVIHVRDHMSRLVNGLHDDGRPNPPAHMKPAQMTV